MDDVTLRALARRNRHDKARERQSHATLVDAIWRARDEGWDVKRIAAAASLSRERIRQICHPRYRKRKANGTRP